MLGRLTPEKHKITPLVISISSGEEANMDFVSEREIVIDIDRCVDSSREVGHPAPADEKMINAVLLPESVDELVRGENSGHVKIVDEASASASPGIGKNNSKREKGKPKSVKKSPKPPRPPRGLLSLDAADQKLIKEIAELAMIKRAKIERMKALKKMRAAKASASSGGNLIAILFTVIFFLVMILQGCHSSHGNKSSIPVPGSGSLQPSTVEQRNLFASVPLTSIESPNIMQPVPGSDISKSKV